MIPTKVINNFQQEHRLNSVPLREPSPPIPGLDASLSQALMEDEGGKSTDNIRVTAEGHKYSTHTRHARTEDATPVRLD